MNHSKIVVVALAAVCLAWGGSSADGAYMDVRIDLNDYYNTSSYPLSANWNVVATPSSTPQALVDYVTGLDSGATIAVTGSFIDSTNSITAFSWSNALAPWVETPVLYDYLPIGASSSGSSGVVTLGGLDPGSTYRIELLSTRDYAASTTSYLVNGTAGDIIDGALGATGGSTASWNSRTNGYVAQDFMLWEAVTPDSSGQIVIDVSGYSNQIVFFSGLRISAVPEPSALALLAGGGLAMVGGWFVRRHRRRAAR